MTLWERALHTAELQACVDEEIEYSIYKFHHRVIEGRDKHHYHFTRRATFLSLPLMAGRFATTALDSKRSAKHKRHDH